MNTSKRILLIDDDIDDQLFFQWAVAHIDPSVECVFANNGVEGIKKLAEMNLPPNLVFLDLNMPLMNGFDCLRHIREKKMIPDVSVIIFSTSNNEKDIAKAKEFGAAGYLKKPNDTKILVKTLTEIFSVDFKKTEDSIVF
ncbi:response regulator [Aquiflexum sp.]|uniref:response regulator n=1 Tax=Aquiflexum sp. TaxID=1872584 RepID=UPI0035931C1C